MRYHSRKLRLTPLQGEILRLLEEAGEHGLTSLINTPLASFADLDPESRLVAVEQAIKHLLDLGFVSFALYRSHYGQQGTYKPIVDLAEIFPLSRIMEWVEDGSYWSLSKDVNDGSDIDLILTREGYKALAS